VSFTSFGSSVRCGGAGGAYSNLDGAGVFAATLPSAEDLTSFTDGGIAYRFMFGNLVELLSLDRAEPVALGGFSLPSSSGASVKNIELALPADPARLIR
jgi:hypothetical protein